MWSFCNHALKWKLSPLSFYWSENWGSEDSMSSDLDTKAQWIPNKLNKNKLEKLLQAVIKYTPKVCDLYKLIIEFKGTRDKEFHKYLKDKLADEFNIDEY